jgi:hypothetical protein
MLECMTSRPAMKTPALFLAALLACTPPAPTFAQSDDSGSEEFIILSPFVVSSGSDSDYRTADSLAGARLSTPLIDPASANAAPSVPISIFKRAESVAIQFVLSHAGDKQEVRNRELYASIEALESAVSKNPGLRLEQREVRFSGANRKLFSTTRGNTAVSFASIVIFAELSAEARIADRVKQVRDVLQATQLAGQTKTADGSVGLHVRHPEQYRGEILTRIFADFQTLKEGLGTDFEILPSGLNQRVRTRLASEEEIELWIDYSFSIRSVRELARPVSPRAS